VSGGGCGSGSCGIGGCVSGGGCGSGSCGTGGCGTGGDATDVSVCFVSAMFVSICFDFFLGVESGVVWGCTAGEANPVHSIAPTDSIFSICSRTSRHIFVVSMPSSDPKLMTRLGQPAHKTLVMR